MPVRLTADDFFTGLFAGLASIGTRRLSIRGDRFDRAAGVIATELIERHGDSVELGFRVQPHYIHGDSAVARNAIAAAAQADLISLDNPEYQDIRFKISPHTAELILNELPLERAIFVELAEAFLLAYDRVATVQPAEPVSV